MTSIFIDISQLKTINSLAAYLFWALFVKTNLGLSATAKI